MATDLTNVAVSTGYTQLLHIDGGIGGSATRVYDGDGTGSPLEISTTELVIKDGSFNLDIASHDGTNGLKLGGTLVTTSAAELNLLDGITAGTVSASKFLLVDSNKDLTGLRNLTATGTITAANFTGTGNTQIGDAAADTVAMNATITTNLIFEGSTDNAYETTLAITDPTADRTWTIPDATDTSVGRATTDTLTNKTLTAPDINTPDIDGGTVDAITSLTVANSVDIGNYTLTANGLTIDGTFTDGTLSIASGSIASAVNGTFSGTVQAEQLTTTDDLTVSGLATIGETLAVTGVATFTAQSVHNGGLTTGALVMNDGSITDTSGTISFGNENLTTTGVGTFASLDISGSADIDGTMEADAYTVDGTALNEYIADTVGSMVGSNTETNITVTYEDGDNTLDFVIGTLNQDTTGTADNFTVSANNSTDETVYPIFVDGATGSQGAESDTGLTYNPSSGLLTISGELDAGSLDISGNADIDGTLEADAITVNGTTLAEYITDQAGGMFSSNTESGITVTFQDGDNTVDLSVDAAQTGINSLLATDIKIGEDDQTKIDFEDADKINFYAGNEKQLILEDGALYPGSDNIIDLGKSDNEFKDAYFDGTVTADAFAGPITGAVTGNADTATLSTTVTVTDSTANTNFPVVFHNESNGLLDDTGALRYNPSTGELLVPKLTVAGTTTTADTVTMEAANAIVFEGATADSNETTLSIVDPTSDHTQYLINQGGYIPVLAAATTTAISATPAELNILDGATLSVSELNILDGVTATAAEINLIDGGTARGTTAVASGDGILINDGGTMRMTNVDTVSTYFASHNVGGSNIITTGAINSGSITSGFGTIDTGSSNITTTGLISGGSLDIDDVLINGSTIGHTDDTDLITVANGLVTVAGEISTTTLDIGGTNVTSTAAELNALDGITAVVGELNALDIGSTAIGTAVASKAVILDANKDYTGVRNLTISGELDAATLDISGDIDVDGTTNLDVVDIDGAVDMASTLAVGGVTTFGDQVVLDADNADLKLKSGGSGDAQIGFWDGSSNKAYFVWDRSDDRMELLTSLDFLIDTDTIILGNVGIGTVNPGGVLQIDAGLGAPSDLGNFEEYHLILRDSGGNTNDAVGMLFTSSADTYGGSAIVHYDTGSGGTGDLAFYTKQSTSAVAPAEVMRLTDDGNVGIGIESPDANSNLHIEGSGYKTLLIDTSSSGGGGLIVEQGGTQASYYGTGGSSWLTNSATTDALIRAEANLIFATNGNNERMRIASDGKVGIGEDSPDEELHISADQAAPTCLKIEAKATGERADINLYGIKTDNGGFAEILFVNNGDSTGAIACERIGANDAGELSFVTQATGAGMVEKMRITSTGHLVAQYLNQTGSTSSRYPLYWVHSGTNGSIEPYTGSVRAMKKDIADMGSVDWIHSLTPRSFKFRDFEDIDGVRTYKDTTNDNPITEYGLIAEEVDEVEGSDYIVDKDSDGKVKGVLYHNLVPILLKAIQELSAKVEALENA